MLVSITGKLLFLRGRLSTLLLLFLSALGFSLGLLIARLHGSEAVLYNVLNFQSTVTLFGFFLQMGFRASLRFHVHENRPKLVSTLESMLTLLLLLLSVVGLFFEFISGEYYFLSASSVLAVVTLKLTLSVARESKRKQLCYTFTNLFICFMGSFFYIVLKDDVLLSGFIIELVSVLILIFVYILDTDHVPQSFLIIKNE